MGADILCLQAQETASEGGKTFVASSWKIYNDLMKEDPEVVETLFAPTWPIQV
jgi:hypothetical protein